ncbi:saccharopine dehydrogenase-like oxidoreductase [Daphnia pulicaria]|uniref:saccharopine dehydrogenase-like oxidoreductase n=1 Tax=Daphnia pulicaria TaxID=35523 RepID=UPI001EEA0B9D|nr:saccharopine dehydrogenase-like oxidoreductase [Daphnia pulicaria]XP_046635142.1 saccharopine dehydrogenase-like oxidoreductase [Daphnia pulicaria]
MAREYDLIIFGATGFTGQYVVMEVARVADEEKLTWAVAGRHVEKLKQVLEKAENVTGKSLTNVGVIKADVSDPNSLSEMAKKGKIVLNCVGPYRFYGEAVVKACVENGTSHLDISGEPQFLERMQLDYNSTARDNDCYVVGACGFDSIPADMGTVFLEQEFDGQVNSVETYLNIKAKHGFRLHYGTWQSAIYGFACANELKPLRKKLFPQRLPECQPKLKSRGPLHQNPIVKSWCLPFPGSDRSVVMRSQRYLYEKEKKRPVQMSAYVQFTSLIAAVLMISTATVFGIFASFKFGRSLLEKYPKVFSFGAFDHKGPTKKEMDGTSFVLTLAGKGWSEKLAEPTDVNKSRPEKELVVQVSGPEPGYVATPICLVQAALVLLREADKLPSEGGVYPPGAAFGKTSLIKRLTKYGVKFETGLKSSL